MKNPLLFLEYPDLKPADFDLDVAMRCVGVIKKLYNQGAKILTPAEVDQEINRQDRIYSDYEREGGLDYLKDAYEFSQPSNFKIYYERLKKYSLLRRLKAEHYDISDYYIDNKNAEDNPLNEAKALERFNNASLEDILNNVESKYNIIRRDFLTDGEKKGDPAEGIFTLIDKLKESPDIGPDLEGKLFNYACRGARQGCFFLKSASTNAGKTRTSVFDACKLAYPIRWSKEDNTFVRFIDYGTGEIISRKVLFIVTEMDKEELQTIMLAYLSGVDEDHILRGDYQLGEESRVRYAGKIIEDYKGCFIIEEISEPNLVNVEATIKKYATLDKIKYVFFDYIHTTASMMNQFAKNNLREDSILMMMANQLKQIAKDYNVFIFSATQVNATAMSDDGEFKNETCIRGAKSIADKCDMGYVMTRISEQTWQKMLPSFKMAAREGRIDARYLEDNNKPTHIIDIYKMRRGRFKNVRIWLHLHLGTGEREDLFMTDMNNCPIDINVINIYSSYNTILLDWKEDSE